MTLNRIRRVSFIFLLLILTVNTSFLTLTIVRGKDKESSEKKAVLEGIARSIAPSVWGYYSDTATILLDDFVERERHPYLVILQSSGDVFYYHRESPPGEPWYYRLGILNIRSLELPVIHDDFPIAVVRTDYVSSQTVKNLTLILLAVLAGLLAVLIRRIVIVSVSRSRALIELKETQRRLVDSDRVEFFNLLSMKLAHEFNTPLGIIVTAQSFLSGNDISHLRNDEGQKMLTLIGDAANRMKALIRRMQDSVPDKEPEEIQVLNIRELITGVIMVIRRDNDDIEIEIPEGLNWPVRQKALNLVLEELIRNASLHGRSEDGKLSLNVSCNLNDLFLQLVFEDGGSGIPEHLENQIFSPFSTVGRMQRGTGLGLYLARNYAVELLQGDLVYTPGLENGSNFCLTIPRKASDIDLDDY